MNNKNWTVIKKTSLQTYFSNERGIENFKITDELIYYVYNCGYAIRKIDNHWIIPSTQYDDVMNILKWKPVFDTEWENRKKRKTRNLLMFGL